MTTAQESVELTRVGPGTAMGEVMRCYWLPAVLASEVERDGPPVRFKLLGEPTRLPGVRLEASYARTEASSPQTEPASSWL